VHVVGGTSVATVEERMPDERIADVGAALCETAALISDRRQS
jgi:hypothetical protein